MHLSIIIISLNLYEFIRCIGITYGPINPWVKVILGGQAGPATGAL
jgi:hypothetical protein